MDIEFEWIDFISIVLCLYTVCCLLFYINNNIYICKYMDAR